MKRPSRSSSQRTRAQIAAPPVGVAIGTESNWISIFSVVLADDIKTTSFRQRPADAECLRVRRQLARSARRFALLAAHERSQKAPICKGQRAVWRADETRRQPISQPGSPIGPRKLPNAPIRFANAFHALAMNQVAYL
jgi:hypothetical protein